MKPGNIYTVLIVFLLTMFCPLLAEANVTITPTTVMIQGRDKYADVTLINSSDTPTTYEMHWRFFKMEEGTGEYITIPGPLTEFDLSKHIVFTPKRITIPPKGVQKVRMALRLNGATPAPGDYRGHFEFKELRAESPSTPSTKPSVGVRINIGFSIPVVYRVGESDAGAKIGNVELKNEPHTNRIVVIVPITRTGGPFGLQGNLSIYYKPEGGSESKVGETTNANIFPEVTTNTMSVPLMVNNLRGGTLRVVYQDRDTAKNIIFDQKTIPIGK